MNTTPDIIEEALKNIVAYALGTPNWEADLDPVRESLTTIYQRGRDDEREQLKKFVVGLGWSAENETPEIIRILKDVYDHLNNLPI